ncbi:MAG: DUF1566 domain-containing protein [Steroidobacteraceae bacterium]
MKTFASRGVWALLALSITVASGALRADAKFSVYAQGETRISQGVGDYTNFYDLLLVELPSLIREKNRSQTTDVFPLDSGVIPTPWTNKTVRDDFGYWLYAGANGRVRTLVRTGADIGTSSAAKLFLVWRAGFARGSGPLPTFTLNKSWLELRARQFARGPQRLFDPELGIGLQSTFLTKDDLEAVDPEALSNPLPPFASMNLHIFVATLSSFGPERDVIVHSSKVSGIAYDAKHDTQLDYASTRGLYDRNFDWRAGAAHPVELNQVAEYLSFPYCIDLFQISSPALECQQEKYEGFRYEIGPYTGQIDLDAMGIRPGDLYSIYYVLEAAAGEDQAEQFAEAYLADPLDNEDGGFSLETTDESVEAPSQLCDQSPDPQRFDVRGDGTTVDRRTGLMWQRCPVGMTLNDQGTADIFDDTCAASAEIANDWQSALQAANDDTTAGHQDWRLPDVKELESIVLPSCAMPAADRGAFPDTPAAPFWSSTPLRQDPIAWQVEFLRGDVRWARTEQQANARLVRSSGEEPVLLRPKLSIGDARSEEGAAGQNATLRFPIRLSRAQTEDVSVSWATQGESATADDDFTRASGVLVIPAGTTSAAVEVATIGDHTPERNEELVVLLTNASPNAHLAVAVGRGVIVDDEPRIRWSVAEAREGDSATTELVLRGYLDRAATVPLTFGYSTGEESARAGIDYQARSGTAVVSAGEQALELRFPIIGDAIRENDEQFTILLDYPAELHPAAGRIAATIVDDDGPGTLNALNDTGVTHCATGASGGLACPQSGLPAQDGEVGRDITDADPGDGDLGFSYVKLNFAGDELASNATTWTCTRDEVTGLVWENKSNDMASERYAFWTYTWRNGSGIDDGGDPGIAGGGQCLAAGTCDTEQYVATINASTMCGFSDWRLPTVDELYSLGHFSLSSNLNSRGIENNYFRPNPINGEGAPFWTATPSAGKPGTAWMVQMSQFGSRARDYEKATPAFIRLVRGGTRRTP